MAFTLLAMPEPLLKQGHVLGMIGDWGEHYQKKWYRIKRTRVTIRDWYAGIMPADATAALEIDPGVTGIASTISLSPRYYETIYQSRIGLSPDWMCYIRWPTDEYRGGLEEPNRAPNPTEDATSPYRSFIGFIDSKDSPIAPLVSFDKSSALEDMRFEFFFVRDWMPIFHGYPNFFTTATSKYVKIIMRFLLNMLTIEPINDPATREKLEAGHMLYKPVLHYSEYVGRGVATPSA